jgi:hypothetical protein
MSISFIGGFEDASGRTKRFAAIVRRFQIAVRARQLYPGPIDGIAGRVPGAALRKFQTQRLLSMARTIIP